jgi:(1->4)-alpha-D-glucan 1-alpha-D-glucosylmutase
MDPDNRRTIDFDARRRVQGSRTPGFSPEKWQDGAVKQLLISALLAQRKSAANLFSEGTYEPLEIIGQRADDVIGFVRRHQADALMVIVTRLNSASDAEWGNTAVDTTRLEEKNWQNVIDGRGQALTRQAALVSDLLGNQPFAVLHLDTTSSGGMLA